MCLGIPMQVIAVKGLSAHCNAQGVEREVSLFMLQDEPVAVGDYLMVHTGYALEKMTPQQAQATWVLYDEALRAEASDTAS